MQHRAPVRGEAFHRLLRACLSQDYRPTHDDIELLACKIWQDGFASASDRHWDEVVPGSDDHNRMMGAARMALGVI